MQVRSGYGSKKRSRRRLSRSHILARAVIVLVVVLVIVAAGCAMWRDYQQSRVRADIKRETSKFAAADVSSTVTRKNNYRLRVTYPITKQGQVDIASRAEINTYVDQFRKLAAAKPKGSRPYELNITGVVNYASKTAINVVYTGTWYVGGSKPGKLTVAMLFDRETGKQIRTADLFENASYLQDVSNTARQELPSTLGTHSYDKKLVEQGTTATPSHFENFEIVDDETIYILFEPGQVASPALGTVKVPFFLGSDSGFKNTGLIRQIFQIMPHTKQLLE